MSRCIQLAKNGIGSTYPNPLVGCVIVHEDKIIGEGWHRVSGEPHAEVNAIKGMKNKDLLQNSTLYVNLEPCSHFGKTPPCSDLILAMRIPRVVIGSTDPNPRVAGQGIAKLKAAGCEVITDILKVECDALNKRFFTFHLHKRPYILLKWAQSQDGLFAPELTDKTGPVWITNTYTQQYVHKMRTMEQSILVGTKTALTDDPQLSARAWHGTHPTRIVLDRDLSLPSHLALFDGTVSTLIFSTKKGDLRNNVTYIIIDFEGDVVKQILENLYDLNFQSLIVEGGAKTLNMFIESDLWDEAYVLEGPVLLHQGIKAPSLKGDPNIERLNSEDKLFHYKNMSHC